MTTPRKNPVISGLVAHPATSYLPGARPATGHSPGTTAAHGHARQRGSRAQAIDTQGRLLLNQDVQTELDGEIHNLYNFKFDKADRQFRSLRRHHPQHPVAYFLLSLTYATTAYPPTRNVCFLLLICPVSCSLGLF